MYAPFCFYLRGDRFLTSTDELNQFNVVIRRYLCCSMVFFLQNLCIMFHDNNRIRNVQMCNQLRNRIHILWDIHFIPIYTYIHFIHSLFLKFYPCKLVRFYEHSLQKKIFDMTAAPAAPVSITALILSGVIPPTAMTGIVTACTSSLSLRRPRGSKSFLQVV